MTATDSTDLMSRFLASLYVSLKQLVEPLLERISSLERIEYLFYRYGWQLSHRRTGVRAHPRGARDRRRLSRSSSTPWDPSRVVSTRTRRRV